ncbi:MAG: PLDc N-terminal domain-containing protein [Opitutaceae bacterium]|nr:PLDc N-terminal domain-containing protein [Opitutaceae bacterium]
MTLGDWLASAWGIATATATLGAAVVASGHAILYKRDTRSTVLWVAFIWLAPVAGPIGYLLLGINRIQRRAVLLRSTGPRRDRAALSHLRVHPPPEPPVVVVRPELGRLIRLVERVVQAPLQSGNRIEPRFHGDQAYPDMIAAIDGARHSVALCTYIFDRDRVGLRFVEALRRAVRRGVQVRVLVDDTGARYSLPSIVSVLRQAGVRVARFLPTLAPIPTFALNMRCHRKLLIADGTIAFTGGMNIRAGHETGPDGRLGIADTHFRVEGPVVAQLRDVFADDWLFTTGEVLEGPEWFPDLAEAGDAYARVVDDGPDENLDRLRWTLLGALASATTRVCIATPYFLPDAALISALNTTALRGVAVEIILPEKNNLPFVQWASTAHLWQVLERGCRVFMTPGPFDHSKIMIVDGAWSFFGSSNWDPRSLRLNFELDVECYSMRLARELCQWFDGRRAGAHEVTLAEVNGRPLPVKLRDGIARLATPFL